jgi:hypothetical protein
MPQEAMACLDAVIQILINDKSIPAGIPGI